MWCDFYTGKWYDGGQVITIDVTLDSIPLFVRDGGIIPMGKVMSHVGAESDNLREIHIFPHSEQGDSHFSLIEDDGLSFDYQQGFYSSVNIHMQARAETIEISLDIAPNKYSLPYQKLEFILPSDEKRIISGGSHHWIDEQNRQHVTVSIR